MCVRETRKGLRRLEAGFADLGLEFVPSQANFVLVKVGDGREGVRGAPEAGHHRAAAQDLRAARMDPRHGRDGRAEREVPHGAGARSSGRLPRGCPPQAVVQRLGQAARPSGARRGSAGSGRRPIRGAPRRAARRGRRSPVASSQNTFPASASRRAAARRTARPRPPAPAAARRGEPRMKDDPGPRAVVAGHLPWRKEAAGRRPGTSWTSRRARRAPSRSRSA